MGARGGVHELVVPIASRTAVLGFEADPIEAQRLSLAFQDEGPWQQIKILPVAVAGHSGSATLHMTAAASNSSLLSTNPIYIDRYDMDLWREVSQEKLHTSTIDEVIFSMPEANVLWGEIIKLDTQGTEFEVLSAAARVLTERTICVVTEVSFCELYTGQKMFSEIELLLRERGFSFYGFGAIHNRSQKTLNKDKHYLKERPIQADAIFFKDPFSGSPGANLDSRQQALLCLSAILLQYYDFAAELANHAWGEAAGTILELINNLSSYPATQTVADAEALLSDISQNSEMANRLVGRFVDERRQYCDYKDVLKTPTCDVMPVLQGTKSK